MEDKRSVFIEVLYAQLRPLLDLMEELRGIGLESFIKLPQIAVVGEQSTGKSSVLESIVGEDFLYKADELATRVPMNLRLIRERYPAEDFETYAELHASSSPEDKKRCSMNQLAGVLKDKMEEIAGDNFNIVSDSINVDIHSKDCPELTLVDLPGIAKNPRPDSDQTEEIEMITTNLITTYIEKPETIILAIVPANTDLAASDALKLARRHDKEGSRTVGVLTKIDIMDKGTSAKKALQGEFYALKHGYVGVKNRSQEDINKKKTVRESIRDEEAFFRNHKEYSMMDGRLFGAKNLSIKLMEILKERIEENIPKITQIVDEKKAEVEAAQLSLGKPVPDGDARQLQYGIQLIQTFTNNLDGIITGSYHNLPREFKEKVTGGAFGAAVIKGHFDQFKSDVQSYVINQHLENSQIDNAIRNSMGLNLSDFLPFSGFKNLVIPQIENTFPMANRCLDNIYQYVEQQWKDLVKSIFRRYPAFEEEVTTRVKIVMSELKDDTTVKMNDFLETQKYVYTVNQNYTAQRSEPNGGTLEQMRSRIEAYFSVYQSICCDAIPQYIATFMLNKVSETLQAKLFEVQNFRQLLKEPDDVTIRRDKIKQHLDILSKAQNLLLHFSI